MAIFLFSDKRYLHPLSLYTYHLIYFSLQVNVIVDNETFRVQQIKCLLLHLKIIYHKYIFVYNKLNLFAENKKCKFSYLDSALLFLFYQIFAILSFSLVLVGLTCHMEILVDFGIGCSFSYFCFTVNHFSQSESKTQTSWLFHYPGEKRKSSYSSKHSETETSLCRYSVKWKTHTFI